MEVERVAIEMRGGGLLGILGCCGKFVLVVVLLIVVVVVVV